MIKKETIMSEQYALEKEYIGNAIRRAYADGVEFALGAVDTGACPDDEYVDQILDDMIRGDKPIKIQDDLWTNSIIITNWAVAGLLGFSVGVIL